MSERILKEKGLVVRHSALELMEHWSIALSGLILLLTGMFQLPMANRYYITSLPGLAWSGNFFTSLYIHYAASAVFIAASFFHLLYHGLQKEKGLIPQKGDMQESVEVIKSFFGKGEEPPFHKYLPEQRLAYVGMALIIGLLIFSGFIKIYKNVYAPDMNYAFVFWATWIHNIGFLLFILAFAGHIGAIVLKPNRPMVRGILTGRVRLDYAVHRHALWIEELEGKQVKEPDTTLKEIIPSASDESPVKEITESNSSLMPDTGVPAELTFSQEAVPVEENRDMVAFQNISDKKAN